MVFFLKKYSDSQCCWKKYSDFDEGKKNNLIQLCNQVKDNMCNSFLDFWNGERVDVIGNNGGKLDT
jgi:hypothetical protein